MTIVLETRTEQNEHGWRDYHGFIAPFQSGDGPRSDPKRAFPTGPSVGERTPGIEKIQLSSTQ